MMKYLNLIICVLDITLLEVADGQKKLTTRIVEQTKFGVFQVSGVDVLVLVDKHLSEAGDTSMQESSIGVTTNPWGFRSPLALLITFLKQWVSIEALRLKRHKLSPFQSLKQVWWYDPLFNGTTTRSFFFKFHNYAKKKDLVVVPLKRGSYYHFRIRVPSFVARHVCFFGWNFAPQQQKKKFRVKCTKGFCFDRMSKNHHISKGKKS